MKNHVIAYIWDGYLNEVTPEDLAILTHINIAFGLVKDGRVAISHLKGMEELARLRAIKPDLKILLSVGGWGAGGFSIAASTEEGRKLFAQSALETYNELGLDGIDIDWEYPCSDSAGIDASPNDKYTFTLLLAEIRAALPPQAMVTIAVGSGEYFIEGTEMDKVQQYLDYVQLMTYDMRGGFSGITGHHTNLFQPEGDKKIYASTEHSVKIFNEAGVPLEKLVIGAALYSRRWHNLACKDNNGLHQPTNDQSVGSFGVGYTKLKDEMLGKNGFVRYWDDSAKAPYTYNGDEFYSFDDEESVALKCEFLKEKGLLGIMYWEHSCDPKRYLLNAIGGAI